MRNQKSVQRKAKKRNAQRKDFVRRRNINSNVPTEAEEEKVERFANVVGKDRRVVLDVVTKKYKKRIRIKGERKDIEVIQTGLRPRLRHIGYKTIIKKKPVYRNHKEGDVHEPALDANIRNIGMVAYPLKRDRRQTYKTK